MNAASTIGAQLDALARQTWLGEWELLIVDNGSDDATISEAQRFVARLPLRVIEIGPPRSAARARNEGVRVARGRLILFCDADDVLDERWMEEMVAALERHDLVAAMAAHDLLNEPWTRAAREEIARPRLPFAPHLPFASTFGLGVRREFHEAVGGFDETLSALDDVDYTIRLQLAGAELTYADRALVHYRNRETISGMFRQAKSYAGDLACLQRRYGTPRTEPSWKWPLRGWKAIVYCVPRVATRAGRAKLAWRLGWQLGRIAGTVRHFVFAF